MMILHFVTPSKRGGAKKGHCTLDIVFQNTKSQIIKNG